MGDHYRAVTFEELPSHLILEILCSGKLSAMDLVSLEFTSKTFGARNGIYPLKFKSLVDFAAFQLCASHAIFSQMALNSQNELYDRCGGNWKRVLRFLHSLEQSSDMVETSLGNVLFFSLYKPLCFIVMFVFFRIMSCRFFGFYFVLSFLTLVMFYVFHFHFACQLQDV